MKKDGFIATSLIYSFFLVFVAIIGALLNNYIANKTILDRYNENVQSELNSETYTVTIYSKNATIQDGVRISNILTNGNFQSGTNYWDLGGYFSRTVRFGTGSLYKNGRGSRNSYAFQKVRLLGNSTYYFSVDYQQSHNLSLQTYLSTTDSGANNSPAIVTKNNQSANWTRVSQTFKTNITANYEFRIGDSKNTADSNATYFTNAMLINLSSTFKIGYEPDSLWVDSNIRYIDGTVGYIRKTDIESGSSVEIKFEPYKSTIDKVSCTSDNATVPIAVTRNNLTKLAGTNQYVLKINSVESNLVCDVDWR